MRKEVVTFILAVLVLGGLTAMSFKDSGPSGGGTRRGGRSGGAAEVLQARATPGRFMPDTETSWASDGSNVYQTPSETRELAPLELAAPPFPRLVHPGPPLPVDLSPKARRALRRPIVVDPALAQATPEGAGATADATAPGGNAPASQPTAGGGTLVPLGTPLGTVDRLKASLEEEIKRKEQEAANRESEADRRKRMDRITFLNGSQMYGQFSGEKKQNRFVLKHDFDLVRTNVTLSEVERTERLKKFDIYFAEDKKGRLGKPVKYPADTVTEIALADLPENRFQMRVLDANPADVGVQVELAHIVFDAGLYPIAAEHLAGMQKRGLSSPEMWTLLADAKHQLFDYNSEMTTLRSGLQAFPDNAALFSRMGRLQLVLGLVSEARASFETALEKNSNDYVARLGHGEALLRLGRPAEAQVPLKEAVSLAGQDSPVRTDAARVALARAYLGVGDFKNAHEVVDLVLRRAALTAPDWTRIHQQAIVLTVVAALAQGQTAEAKTRADEGIKLYSLSGPLAYAQALVLLQSGDLRGARSRFQTSLDLDPLLTGPAQVAMAMIDEASGKDDLAVASAKSGAVDAAPAALELRALLGRALLNMGDSAKARENLLLALDHEPENSDVVVALGDCAYAEGNFPDALRFYDRATKLDPEYPDLLARRVITDVRSRRIADAEDLVSKIPGAKAKDPFLQAAQAFFHYLKGNQTETLNVLKRLGDADGPAAARLAAYGRAAFEAITAQQNKVIWADTFSRTGSTLGRGWTKVIKSGVNVALKDQTATFDGTQGESSDKPTVMFQERPGDRLERFSVDLDLQPQPGVYAGVALIAYSQGAKVTEPWPGYMPKEGGLEPFAGIQVALAPEGGLMFRLLQKAKMTDWQPVTGTTFAGGPCTMEIRFSDPREGIVDVYVNRDKVLSHQFDELKRWRRTLDLQVFTQAQIGRKVHLVADNVSIVTYKEVK